MKNKLLLPAILALTALSGPLDANPTDPVEALFSVSADGWRLGELEASYRVEGRRYEARLKGAAKGLWGFFLRATYDGSAAGRLAKGGVPVPEYFEAKSHRIFKTRHQRVDFKAGQPAKVMVDPPKDRTALSDPLLVTDTRIDPLSFLGIFIQDREAGCPAQTELYDGRRETRVSLNPVTTTDGSLACDGVYEIVKGPDHSIRRGFRRFGVRITYRKQGSSGPYRMERLDFTSGRNTIVIERMK